MSTLLSDTSGNEEFQDQPQGAPCDVSSEPHSDLEFTRRTFVKAAGILSAGVASGLPRVAAAEKARIAAQSRRHGWSLFTHYRSHHDIIEKAEAALDAVGLLAKAEELAANLSHGEQRTLEIAIALATEPQLLCLDEPTAGMSAAETHDTMQLVRRIAENLTILIVEHDMPMVMELADRITVFHYGEILAEGPPAEIQKNPRVLEVYLKT